MSVWEWVVGDEHDPLVEYWLEVDCEDGSAAVNINDNSGGLLGEWIPLNWIFA